MLQTEVGNSGQRSSNHKVNGQLAKQVVDISLEVAKNWGQHNEIGLLEGKSGMLLLLAYLSKLFPEKYDAEQTSVCINQLAESLANDELGYSFCNGVAGVGFVFQHLRNINVPDQGLDLDLSELDEFISLGVDHDLAKNNWDPLLGMTGLGIYFLERNTMTGAKDHLERIVDYLASMRVSIGGSKVWVTPGVKKFSNDNYNFGMAHGMSGVLSFLAQVHARGIKQELIEEIISSSFSFLLDYEYSDHAACSFPAAVDVSVATQENKPYSRLAWCYGDLCMANTLIHCGKALQRSDWFNKGIAVALKTTRRGLEDSGCVDASFCHGTVGLAHQYHRLFLLTRIKSFLKARNTWIDITQKTFYKAGDGAGGYYYNAYDEKTDRLQLTPKYGLLEGSVGIALVYLSIISGIEPAWDIIFLTNI